MEFCQKCLSNNCDAHKWFTEQKLTNKKDVLIAELLHVLKSKILDYVIEKTFLVENQIDNCSYYLFSYVSGKLFFHMQLPTSAIKNDYYIPLQSHGGKDKVCGFQIEVNVDLMRHNPMEILIKESIFSDEILHRVKLLSFNESLHTENMDDCNIIKKRINTRLANFVGQLKEDYTIQYEES